MSYEMSLQFALAPLGGGFLKQRDRLRGEGRVRQRRVEKQEGDGRETETQILNTKSKRPERGGRQAGSLSRVPAPNSRLRKLRKAPSGAQKRVNSSCKPKCENC